MKWKIELPTPKLCSECKVIVCDVNKSLLCNKCAKRKYFRGYFKEYYQRPYVKKKMAKYQRAYVLKNLERVKENSKRYYERNKDKILARNREYYSNNKDKWKKKK